MDYNDKRDIQNPRQPLIFSIIIIEMPLCSWLLFLSTCYLIYNLKIPISHEYYLRWIQNNHLIVGAHQSALSPKTTNIFHSVILN